MATKNTPPTPDTAPLSTPENTPLPGGGSWCWSATLPGWVENVPYGEAVPAFEPIPLTITE